MNFKSQLTGPDIPFPSLSSSDDDAQVIQQPLSPAPFTPKFNYAVVGQEPPLTTVRVQDFKGLPPTQFRPVPLDD